MDKYEVIEFLEERLAKIRENEPYARNAFAAYEYVISDLSNEE